MFCTVCIQKFDPTKDFFITINERKGPALHVCSLPCAIACIEDEG